ncbi:MAG TPA: UbiH/UbiF/VisC/COQ6 family ubiquinone biosynthesis hydroxylase [Nevskiales bacterium]|nr:UbiH/UbiF/VisC/COQ6 family ubiquinone biosynthesis hydroxylase [Nevskiales bacterium]
MTHDVAIVGAGMVGTPLAVALQRAGFDVALIEASPPAHYDPKSDYDLRVSALSAASQRLLERLGIWPVIAAGRISPYREMQVWDSRGAGVLHFDAAELGLPQLGHIVENSLIQHAAWQALDRVSVYCPARLLALELGGDGYRLVFEGRDAIEAGLVVGADGAESRVRELAGIGCSGWSYAQQGIVCNVATEKPHRHTAWQRFLPTGPLAFLPLADGRCSIVWSADAAEAAALLALDDEAFRQRLAEAFGGELGEVTMVSRRAAFPLRMLHADRYVQSRLALVGDAAHVIHPLAGQGVNLGLLDVAALVEVLAQARREGRDIGELRVLQKYERWRRGDNLLMTAATDGLKRLFGSRNPLLAFARSRGLGMVNAITPLKNLLIRHAMGIAGDLPPLVRRA